MAAADSYSQVANAQLDALESGPDHTLYLAVLDACDLIFRLPGKAQSLSSAIVTSDGATILRLPVSGHSPFKVFWTSAGPRVEAVFPHP